MKISINTTKAMVISC